MKETGKKIEASDFGSCKASWLKGHYLACHLSKVVRMRTTFRMTAHILQRVRSAVFFQCQRSLNTEHESKATTAVRREIEVSKANLNVRILLGSHHAMADGA